MPYLVGVTLALLVAAMARVVRMDRDSAFYPTVLMVVASYYVLFGAMAGSPRSMTIEAVVMGAFVTVALIGFRKSAWLVAAGLAAHGVFDLFHGSVIVNRGVPTWWPAFCSSYDVVAALTLTAVILEQRVARGRRTVAAAPQFAARTGS